MRTSNLPARRGPDPKPLERRARELNAHQLNEAAALTSQRALGAWEKLRRAVAHLLVAGTAARDLLLRAKHLVFAAIVACRRAASRARLYHLLTFR
jgi:hypothetical protein